MCFVAEEHELLEACGCFYPFLPSPRCFKARWRRNTQSRCGLGGSVFTSSDHVTD